MKRKHISLFCISLLFISTSLLGQEEVIEEADTISIPTKYGLRVGLDLAKPLRTLLEDGYTGFEIMADFRVSKKLYIAAEIGNSNGNNRKAHPKVSRCTDRSRTIMLRTSNATLGRITSAVTVAVNLTTKP